MLFIPTDIDYGVEFEFFAPGKFHGKVMAALRSGLFGIPCVNNYDEDVIAPEQMVRASWILKKESLNLDRANYHRGDCLPCEVASPILNGKPQLENVRRLFGAVQSIDGFTNIDCGYHVYTSPAQRAFTQGEKENFIAAVLDQQDCYQSLIAPHRDTNPNCLDYFSDTSKKAKITTHRIKPSAKEDLWKNAAEWRGKEADGFDIDHGNGLISYTALVIAFTSLAIKDPKATFEQAADMVFAHIPSGRPQISGMRSHRLNHKTFA